MKVYAKHNLIVESSEARNKKGNKLRKSREIKEGEAFEVKRELTAIGGLELIGPNEETYQVVATDFIKEKQGENELGRLTRCIHEIVKDPENEEFTLGFRENDHPDVKRIHLERSVGGKKVFVQGIMDSRYIYPQAGGSVKEHAVIYFQGFNGDMHKKWVYPSKNKSDEFLKRKIRSIMREWVTELVEKEEKAQEEDQKIRKEQEQLGVDLEEFHPVYTESGRGVIIDYGNPKKNFRIRVELNEFGNYKVSLRTSTNPAFTKEDLKALLKVLSRAA